MSLIKELKQYKKPFILNDFLLLFSLLLFSILVCSSIFILPSKLNENISLAIFLPISILFLISFSLYLFIETNHNNLNLRNPFLLGGIIVGLVNMVVSIAMPSSQILFNNTTIITSNIYKIYYVIDGFLLCLIPYLFIVLIPRRIPSKKFFYILFSICLSILYISILYSLIVEFDSIKTMISSGFKELIGLKSFTFHKNIFGRLLFLGIMFCFIIRLMFNKVRWFFYSIPLYIFLVLSMAKMPIFCGAILLVIYLIIRLIFSVKWNKDNTVIVCFISGFVFTGFIIFFVLFNNATGGILFKVKNVINSITESASKTLSSRKIIWDCTFNILKPWQYIFGYGIKGFDIAIHFVYGNDPRMPSWEYLGDIWSSHNAVIELIARGGILYLLFIVFTVISLIYFVLKLYKDNKQLSLIYFACIITYIIGGFSDSVYLFGDNTEFGFSIVVVLPVMFTYLSKHNDKVIKYRKEIVNSKNDNKSHSSLIRLNEKYLSLTSKLIKNDK